MFRTHYIKRVINAHFTCITYLLDSIHILVLYFILNNNLIFEFKICDNLTLYNSTK